MNLLIAGVILLVLLMVVRYGFVKVEPKHVAIFNLLGWRWRKAKEGPNLKIPFIEKVVSYSAELDRLEINKVKVMSKDKLEIEITGSLESVPEYELLYRYDETRDNQKKAIEDSIKDEIGVLAGTKEAEAFILEREVIQAIINCRLRLAVMPHKQGKYPEVKESNGSIPPEQRIDFYKKNLKKIQDTLRKEKRDSRRSHIEESYGIDVRVFHLSGVDYGEATKKALEAKKQAEFKREAAKEELGLAKSFQELSGVSGQEALNAAQVSLGKAEKKVHSIEGLAGLNINIGGGK